MNSHSGTLIEYAEDKYEYVHCDLCGEDNNELLIIGKDRYNNRPGEFRVVKCKTCGMVFTNPRPYGEELSKFYPDEAGYFQPVSAPKENQGQLKTRLRHKILAYYLGYSPDSNNKWFEKILLLPVFLLLKRDWEISAMPRFTPNGKLLEVGCSYGLYLKRMKDLGWEVTGIEPNKKAADFGNQELGLRIINDNFDHANISEKFDVITLLMVLEHVPYPSRTLEKVKQLLKKDGQLIMSVPDFSGVEFRLFKEYCYALHLPNHLNFFTPPTIRQYCKIYGFKIEKIIHHQFDREFVASVQYMQKDGVNQWLAPLLSNKLVRQTILRATVRLLSYLGMTSRMTVCATAS